MALGIGTAIATFNAFLSTQKSISEGNDAQEAMLNFLKTIQSKEFGLAATKGSITKLLKPFVIEPIIITTDTCRSIEVFDKALQLNTDIFASFYMQAFKILTDHYGLTTSLAIQVLSTDNSSLLPLGQKALIKALSREEAGDVPNYIQAVMSNEDHFLRLSNEAGWFKKLVSGITDPAKKIMEIRARQNAAANQQTDAQQQVDPNNITVNNNYYSNNNDKNNNDKQEHARLDYNNTQRRINNSSFKDLDLDKDPLYGTLTRHMEIQYVHTVTKQTIVLPISVKAHVIISNIQNILNMLAPNARDKRLVNRLDEWRAGAISFWDLIACGDLIASYKKNKLKDKDNLLNIINERVKGSAITAANIGLDKKNVVEGFEKNYNMLIVSGDEKVRLDRHIGGEITKEKYKQDLLEQAHAMTCMVLDQDYERANILTKDIRGVSDIGFKALSRRKDKDNSDMAGIMQSLLTSKPIGF